MFSKMTAKSGKMTYRFYSFFSAAFSE